MTAARRSSRRQGFDRGWKIVAALFVLGVAVVAWWIGTPPSDSIAPPLDEHDAESRARLEAVLREGEREERAR